MIKVKTVNRKVKNKQKITQIIIAHIKMKKVIMKMKHVKCIIKNDIFLTEEHFLNRL
jgi:hypothetical protein